LNDTHHRIVLLEENLRAFGLLGPSQNSSNVIRRRQADKTIELAQY